MTAAAAADHEDLNKDDEDEEVVKITIQIPCHWSNISVPDCEKDEDLVYEINSTKYLNIITSCLCS